MKQRKSYDEELGGRIENYPNHFYCIDAPSFEAFGNFVLAPR